MGEGAQKHSLPTPLPTGNQYVLHYFISYFPFATNCGVTSRKFKRVQNGFTSVFPAAGDSVHPGPCFSYSGHLMMITCNF